MHRVDVAAQARGALRAGERAILRAKVGTVSDAGSEEARREAVRGARLILSMLGNDLIDCIAAHTAVPPATFWGPAPDERCEACR